MVRFVRSMYCLNQFLDTLTDILIRTDSISKRTLCDSSQKPSRKNSIKHIADTAKENTNILTILHYNKKYSKFGTQEDYDYIYVKSISCFFINFEYENFPSRCD